jgi:hypothetical protein
MGYAITAYKILVGNLNKGDFFEDLGTDRDNIGTGATAIAFQMLIISLQVTSTYRINS